MSQTDTWSDGGRRQGKQGNMSRGSNGMDMVVSGLAVAKGGGRDKWGGVVRLQKVSDTRQRCLNWLHQEGRGHRGIWDRIMM